MIVPTTPALARLGARARFGLLVLVAMLVGHSAVYVAEYGLGGFRSAMSASGHDGYWGQFTILALAAGISLALGSALTLWRLHRRLRVVRTVRGGPSGAAGPSAEGSYRHELLAIWPRLCATVIVLFAVQENLETYLSTGDAPGIDAPLGGGLPIAPLVLAIVCLALAAVGALVRWRIATLRARIGRATCSTRVIPTSIRPAREWADIHAAAPHRWTGDRRDAGRAPPVAFPA